MSDELSIQALPQLPVGVQDFPKLREKNHLYVDKTKYLHQLITTGEVYFLSRPRRFGKSLMLSTLECIFKGQRELFKGTWIDASDYDWKEHPVIRIDMSDVTKRNAENLGVALMNVVREIADAYQIKLSDTVIDPADALRNLIMQLSKINSVVVLIDEYDKPILDRLYSEEGPDDTRETLRAFYTVLKSQGAHLRFVFLTGVTKFTKVSIFSGLNNLEDISMTRSFATALGYTQEELMETFEPWIEKLAKAMGRSQTEELEQIKSWYNGYLFAVDCDRVYNPFSTLLLFKHQQYKSHWFTTGTPTFLMEAIKKLKLPPQKFENLKASELSLEMSDVDELDLPSLLYQTGYMTIESYRAKGRYFYLSFPNQEVRMAFNESLLKSYSNANSTEMIDVVANTIEAVEEQDYDAFFESLKTFLAAIPYQLHIKAEKYYQSIFYLIYKLIAYHLNVEVPTNQGRIDTLLELEDRVLIFEFKIDQSAEVALQQIEDKQYAQPYQGLGKEVICFGVNFNTSERNIDEWDLKKLP